jgi:hypothetical protein
MRLLGHFYGFDELLPFGWCLKVLASKTMLGSRLVPLILFIFLPSRVPAQQPQPARGAMRGFVIDHPERLSGSWEVKGDHAIYGLHIQLTTRVDGAPITLIGVQQIFHSALIEVYERTGPTRKVGDGNWISDESPQLLWTDRHLVFKQATTQIGPEVQLDLIFDPVSTSWSGRFRRGTFDRAVTLLRPHPETGAARSPFVGTWSRPAPGNNNCIHIVQTGSESLAAWSDDLATPGASRYANGIQPPVETFERYGSIALVEAVSPRAMLIELKALTAGCCSITYAGKLTPDGKEIQSGQSGSAIRDNWTRMRGDSCVAAPR